MRNSPFSEKLRARVFDEMKSRGLTRYATPAVWIKAMVLLFLSALLYGVLVFRVDTFRSVLVFSTLYGLVLSLLGLNVMHEAAHGNFSPRVRVNQLLAMSLDIFGISSMLYAIKHIQFHHAYTNIDGADGDISEVPILRLAPSQPVWGIHRYQWLYALPLYSLITLSWFFFDLDRLISRKVGKLSFTPLSRAQTLLLLSMKLLHLGLAWVLPCILGGANAPPGHSLGHPFVAVLAVNFYVHVILGTVLALVFQVAHVVEEASFASSDEILRNDWMTHQLLTCADFSIRNPLMNLGMGGLNFQLEHHLFPNVSHAHYPMIHEIVDRTAREFGYKTIVFETFGDAVRSHFRLLKRLGSEKILLPQETVC